MNRKTFRPNGAIGALLDEYERAIHDLQQVISPLSNEALARIRDMETQDRDCQSIQSVLTHVVCSGYCYVIYIRKQLGETLDFVSRKKHDTAAEYQSALADMFAYNEKLFADYPDLQIEELDNTKKILTRWGQLFDIEQLIEHAIVHILRHRRQIEKFMLND